MFATTVAPDTHECIYYCFRFDECLSGFVCLVKHSVPTALVADILCSDHLFLFYFEILYGSLNLI